jgi:superfamily I DNA/RNA helicase
MAKRKKFNPSGLVLTDEQEAIVGHDFQKGETVAVKAFAGSGKTSTLQLLAHALKLKKPNMKILYLAFNAVMKTEADKKFEGTVDAKTTHSLAYSAIGKDYKHKLSTNIRLTDIVENFMSDTFYDKWEIARYAWDTLLEYMASNKKTLDVSFVPTDMGTIHVQKILKVATKIWEAMIDKEHSFNITHDAYLKLYQLSKPNLALQYDMIMVDEAQDSNPALIEIVNSQTCPRIWIGDDHQAIYQFRKAKNAFELINIDKIYYLTKSFRFGNKIAKMANLVLKYGKHEKHPVIGIGGQDELISEDDLAEDEDYTCIYRTNAGLFNKAVTLLESSRTFGIIGGASSSGLDIILDVYNLSRSKPHLVNDKFVKRFKTYREYEQYSKDTEDPETTRMILTISKHGDNIPNYISEIKKRAVPYTKANIILTTAHKCKGMEFNTVLLGGDFCDFEEKNRKKQRIYEEDYNILYVALTRAKKRLRPNKSIYYFKQYETACKKS